MQIMGSIVFLGSYCVSTKHLYIVLHTQYNFSKFLFKCLQKMELRCCRFDVQFHHRPGRTWWPLPLRLKSNTVGHHPSVANVSVIINQCHAIINLLLLINAMRLLIC